jgi:hypothetical protein
MTVLSVEFDQKWRSAGAAAPGVAQRSRVRVAAWGHVPEGLLTRWDLGSDRG